MKKLQIFTVKSGYGVLEREAITLANALSDIFFIELVFYNIDGRKISYELNKNIIVKYIDEKNSPFKRVNSALLGNDIKASIKEYEPDVILSIDKIFNKYIEGFRKVKKVFWLQENEKEVNKEILSSLKYFDMIVYPNNEVKSIYTKVLKTPSCVIPSFINLPKIAGNYESKRIVSIVESKDIDSLSDLLDIISLLAKTNVDIKLNIIGDHCSRTELLEIIRKRSLEKVINLYGDLEINEIIDVMSNNALFINASDHLTDIYIIYALSLGLPVISYNKQVGIKDLVQHELNGYLVKHGHTEEMAKIISELIKSKKNLENIGSCASESITSNDISIIKSEWIKIL